MRSSRIIGVNKLKKKFQQHAEYKGREFEEGIKLGGLIIQAESMRHTPVDTGALRNSHRTEHSGSGFKTVVKVSCQTAYAIFVHENLEAYHNPGTWAKFLYRAARTKRKEVLAVIKAKMGG